MNSWRFSVEQALKRAGGKDLGATAAREGIMGLPLSVKSGKAERVYRMASEARRKHQASLQTRKKPLLEVGKTGFSDMDQAFAELAPADAVTSA